MQSSALLPILAAAALLACGGTTAPVDRLDEIVDGDAPFRTGQPAYVLQAEPLGWETRIDVVFTNPLAEPAYFVNCNGATGVLLQRRADGAWHTVWSPVLPACLSAPIAVAPGGEYRTTVHVFGGYPGGNLFPRFEAPPAPGTYRLVWTDVVTSYHDRGQGFGDPLPLELRASNPFTLTAESR